MASEQRQVGDDQAGEGAAQSIVTVAAASLTRISYEPTDAAFYHKRADSEATLKRFEDLRERSDEKYEALPEPLRVLSDQICPNTHVALQHMPHHEEATAFTRSGCLSYPSLLGAGKPEALETPPASMMISDATKLRGIDDGLKEAVDLTLLALRPLHFLFMGVSVEPPLPLDAVSAAAFRSTSMLEIVIRRLTDMRRALLRPCIKLPELVRSLVREAGAEGEATIDPGSGENQLSTLAGALPQETKSLFGRAELLAMVLESQAVVAATALARPGGAAAKPGKDDIGARVLGLTAPPRPHACPRQLL